MLKLPTGLMFFWIGGQAREYESWVDEEFVYLG